MRLHRSHSHDYPGRKGLEIAQKRSDMSHGTERRAEQATYSGDTGFIAARRGMRLSHQSPEFRRFVTRPLFSVPVHDIVQIKAQPLLRFGKLSSNPLSQEAGTGPSP